MLADTAPRTDRRLEDMPDLERLWWAEFGDPLELLIRCIVIPAAGLGILAYTGAIYGLVWSAAYMALVGLSYLAFRPTGPETFRAWVLGLSCYAVTVLVFLSLPLYLVTMDDFTLKFSGALGVVAFAVFNLFREEPPKVIEAFDLVMGWLVIAVVGIVHIPQSPSLVAQIVTTVLCLVVGGYYTLAVKRTRAEKAELRRAAQRGIEAQKMEAIGRLSGGLAHDFNNILTVIQGSLELYDEVPSTSERTALVHEARRSAQRAAGLVAQLLAFARRAPLEAEVLEAGSVISDISGMARRLLPETITLEEHAPAGMAYLKADPAQLSSALLNLILNARDAMEGRGHILLAARILPGPATSPLLEDLPDPTERHLRLAVTDTGPGMDAVTQARAFEPFFTTKAVGEGSGLGLPMVKGFAEQSGGSIDVQTGPGGTTLALHLPLSVPPSKTDAETS